MDISGFRLPQATPNALSIVSGAQAAPAEADQTPPSSTPAHRVSRWPAQRRAAGVVPDFVPAPMAPQVGPPAALI